MTFRRFVSWILLFGVPITAWYYWPTPFRYVGADQTQGTPEFRISRITGDIDYMADSGEWEPYVTGPKQPSAAHSQAGVRNTPGNASEIMRKGDEIREMNETTQKALEAERRMAEGR